MTSSALHHISIVAPAYNEAQGIEATVSRWITYLQLFDGLDSFEIVICNDGSGDQTGEILRRVERQYPQLTVITHAENQGAGAAMATAIAHTTKEWILLLDADGQFPIENLELFNNELKKNPAQAFIGIRTHKANNVLARFGSWISGCMCNLFHRTHYQDFNSVCKLIDGQLLRSLPLEAKGFETSAEVSSKLLERRVQLTEVPIEHLPRTSGRSSMRILRDAPRRFLFVLYIGFRQFLLYVGVLRRPKVGS